jgi:DUF4097 and DUF4098 domain-containing protein YvlB
MPTFDTPGPISVTVSLGAGDVRITATDRSDTVVDVRPADDSAEGDVRAAEQVRVEYADGALLVKAPKNWRRFSPFGGDGSVDVTLGDCRFRTAAGDIQLGQTGALNVSTAAGDIRVDQVAGRAEVTAASGDVRIGAVGGSAVIKNSNGDSWVGQAAGDLRLVCANGDITVGSASSTATAKTAKGAIRIAEVVRGSMVLETALGDVEIGIREGTAARLDASTGYGSVRNEMESADGPQASDETAEVRARTGLGDILIHRS